MTTQVRLKRQEAIALEVYSWIDPPGMFDAIEAWEAYLKKMETLPKEALEREPAIRKAKRVIKEKRNRAASRK